jgi:hypothetical protein
MGLYSTYKDSTSIMLGMLISNRSARNMATLSFEWMSVVLEVVKEGWTLSAWNGRKRSKLMRRDKVRRLLLGLLHFSVKLN